MTFGYEPFFVCVKDGSRNPFAEFTQQKIGAYSLTATQCSGAGGTPK